MQKLAAGNWKMNGTVASLAEAQALIAAVPDPGSEMLLCPPAPLIAAMASLAQDTPLMVGGQDCHANTGGAHTGDIAAAQLADAGASHVITGHSERRTDHGETSAEVAAKSAAAHQAGLTAIICIGETLAEREAGETLDVVASQLQHSVPGGTTAANTVIAYEPVWAIGTGRIPTLEQIGEVHTFLRRKLTERLGAAEADGMRLLYGGSVKASNAAEVFSVPNVDGALVGGASLTAADFAPIVTALANAGDG